jgi:hypothetical protein
MILRQRRTRYQTRLNEGHLPPPILRSEDWTGYVVAFFFVVAAVVILVDAYRG